MARAFAASAVLGSKTCCRKANKAEPQNSIEHIAPFSSLNVENDSLILQVKLSTAKPAPALQVLFIETSPKVILCLC
jgi:hypothetical protein